MGETSPMRRRITTLSMTAVVTAVLVFAIPLAVAARLLLVSTEFGELQRAALTTAARVDATSLGGGDPVEAPAIAGIAVRVVVAGQPAPTAGAGRPDPLVQRALVGDPGQGRQGGQLVATVPLVQGEQVRGVVRASSSANAVWARTAAVWAAIAGVAVLAALFARAATRRQVRLLVAPVEQLAVDARSLGSPGPGLAGRRSGLPEIDAVAEALQETGSRLQDLLGRERAFAAHASHQLRTPLTGLELVLEEALSDRSTDPWSAMDEALAVARRLETTVEDVLRFTRPDTRTGTSGALLTTTGITTMGITTTGITAGRIADGVGERWRGELARSGRPFSASTDRPDTSTTASPASVRQLLDVLVDNALRHGRGGVEVVVRDLSGHLAVDVADDGAVDGSRIRAILAGGAAEPHGLGLGLARQMVEAEGGRLLLSSERPTTFTALLPGVPTVRTPPAAHR